MENNCTVLIAALFGIAAETIGKICVNTVLCVVTEVETPVLTDISMLPPPVVEGEVGDSALEVGEFEDGATFGVGPDVVANVTRAVVEVSK